MKNIEVCPVCMGAKQVVSVTPLVFNGMSLVPDYPKPPTPCGHCKGRGYVEQ